MEAQTVILKSAFVVAKTVYFFFKTCVQYLNPALRATSEGIVLKLAAASRL